MNRKANLRYLHSSDLLSVGIRLLAAAVLTIGVAACEEDPEPDPEPSTGFKVHIGESNVVEMETDAPSYYPPRYAAILVMEDLPADEKIIYMGGVYSTVDSEPDITDATLIYDYSEYEEMQEWDWEKSPLYWRCMYLFHPVPGTTYYVRGYVQTNKGEYYSNTIEVRSSHTARVPENHEAYEIPVVFHLFPDAEGYYPVREWMVAEQLDYANLVYGNSFGIPGQADAGVRFVAATHAPDGTPLGTPGVVYEKEAVEVDFETAELDDRYVWDMEQVLNVWVCPITNTDGIDTEYSSLAGFAFFPFFDADEVLEGCISLPDNVTGTGIFLNSLTLPLANNGFDFAHEAGHFLGLDHVFATEDFCSDTSWYDFDAHRESTQGDLVLKRTGRNGEEFWSDNIMDYEYGFMTGLTPEQVARISHTLRYAYFIPGPAGKELPSARSGRRPIRFGAKPVR